jgi:hypothetical protein
VKKILENRLKLAVKAAYQAETVKEFNFLIECIREIKMKLEEV